MPKAKRGRPRKKKTENPEDVTVEEEGSSSDEQESVKEEIQEEKVEPEFVKSNEHCVEEGCQNLKALGQTHVCSDHIRRG